MKNHLRCAPASYLYGLVAAVLIGVACTPVAVGPSPAPSFVPPERAPAPREPDPERSPLSAPDRGQGGDEVSCQCAPGNVDCAIKCSMRKDRGTQERPPFNRNAADSAMNRAKGGAMGCTRSSGPKGTAVVHVQFEPSGRPSSVTVAQPFAGTPTGDCIRSAFRGVGIPAFSGTAVVMRKEVPIR